MRLSYGKWMLKWTILTFVGKWMLDTYELVETQIHKSEQAKILDNKGFDPYKLLHIPADGSFQTDAIYASYDRLAEKYHPSRVNKEKVPYVKAKKRWDNLNKAYKTLTDKKAFDKWQQWGDPDGCMTMQALESAVPTWLLEEDMKPVMITWGFIGGLCFLLGFMTW